MGMRKKNNQREAIRRLALKVTRNAKKLKRMAKAKTPGEKLHEKMHATK